MGVSPRIAQRQIAAWLAATIYLGAFALLLSAAEPRAPASLGVGSTLESLTVGKTVYQVVQVRSIGPHSVMISHAGGLAAVPLRDLSPELQTAFGYDPAADKAAARVAAPPAESKRAADTPPNPAHKTPPPLAPSSFDAVLQSFGQPPDVRPSVDLRPKFSDLALNVKNQGPRPSCAVFAIVSALEYQNAQLAGQAERLSEEYLIWATCKTLNRAPRVRPTTDTENPENLDSIDEGFALSEVVTALRTYGIPLQSSMPYSFANTPAADPPNAVIEEARTHRRVSIFVLPGRNAPTRLANLIQALDAGIPIAVGLRWPAWRAVRSAYLDQQKPLEGTGHGVTIVGYENKTGAIKDTVFVFKNSWGVKWGASGYGYATYAYLVANLTDTALLELEPAATPTSPRR